MRLHLIIYISVLLLPLMSVSESAAAESADSVVVRGIESAGMEVRAESVTVADSASVAVDSVPQKKPGLIRRVYDAIYNYIDEANRPKPGKKFDISFLGGPKYSSSRSLGLAVIATGLYSMAPGDTLTPKSSVSVNATGSLSGYYKVGIEGLTIFRGDRYRLGYILEFMSERTKFWGIGYDMATDDDNESKYSERLGSISANFDIELLPNVYIGPTLSYTYVGARRVTKPELWEGLPDHTNSFGPGVSLYYDTRDNINNTYHGICVNVSQQFFPRLFNGDNNFSMTTAFVRYFRPLWRGCIFATQLQGVFTYGHTPWGMLPTIGGSRVMRGYFEGQYRDKDLIDFTVELRQRIWGRHGVVVWGGVANLAPSLRKMRLRQTLPNFGVGYRFEFKQRVNLRLDVGFGRHCKSLELSINEAF